MIGLLQVDRSAAVNTRSGVYFAATSARPNVTAFAFLSSSVNPLLYVFAGSSHIRRTGLGFMAKLFEGTYSENSSSAGRRSTIHTSSSGITKFSVKSFRSGGVARNKSCAEEEEAVVMKRAEPSCMEELKTLTTMP